MALLGCPPGVHAVPLPVSFEYRVDFIDPTLGAAVGLAAKDAIEGVGIFESSLLDPSGAGTLPASPFSLQFGTLSCDETDDVLGGPVIEFAAGQPTAAIFFAAPFSAGGDDFFLELGLSFGGTLEFRVTALFYGHRPGGWCRRRSRRLPRS